MIKLNTNVVGELAAVTYYKHHLHNTPQKAESVRRNMQW